MVMELDPRTGTPPSVEVADTRVAAARQLLNLGPKFICGQGQEVAVHRHPDGSIEIDRKGPGWVVTHHANRGDYAILFRSEPEALAEAAVREMLGGRVEIISLAE